MLALELPYPPSVNTYWRRNGDRYFVSQKGMAYRGHVLNAVPQGFGGFIGLLQVEIMLYPPDKRKRDVDNTCKAILDSLAYARVFADDYQVSRLVVERLLPEPPGKCFVTIVAL